jgi:hypothetical protein
MAAMGSSMGHVAGQLSLPFPPPPGGDKRGGGEGGYLTRVGGGGQARFRYLMY